MGGCVACPRRPAMFPLEGKSCIYNNRSAYIEFHIGVATREVGRYHY